MAWSGQAVGAVAGRRLSEGLGVIAGKPCRESGVKKDWAALAVRDVAQPVKKMSLCFNYLRCLSERASLRTAAKKFLQAAQY